MDEKRGPPSEYQPSNQEHDNPALVTDPYTTDYRYAATQHQSNTSDPYTTQYSYPEPPPPTNASSDPYNDNFGFRTPQMVNPYGYPIKHTQGGYGEYVPSRQTVVVTQPTRSAISSVVPDYMGLALFVTLCCCWPLGIYAITKNSEAKRRAAEGNINGAQDAAASAKKLSIWGIVLGIVFLSISIGVGVGVYMRYKSYYHITVHYGYTMG